MPQRVLRHFARVAQDHFELGVVGRQLEPEPTRRHHLRIELDRRGLDAQLLATEFGERPRPQSQLHGVAFAQTGGLHKQQPGHHALHIFEFDVVGRVQQHRALNPLGSQVQATHIAIVGKIDVR